MQRICTKLRSLALLDNASIITQRRLVHSSTPNIIIPLRSLAAATSTTTHSLLLLLRPHLNAPFLQPRFPTSPLPLSLVQVRHVSSRERKKRRKPMTPVTSKVKKIKIKPYSSFKSRFRIMNDGNIRRWREGKRHNAHLKSKKSKRRLRKPSVVPVAYAKVMKRLNFCA